jgi:hypothetical protein
LFFVHITSGIQVKHRAPCCANIAVRRLSIGLRVFAGTVFAFAVEKKPREAGLKL